MLLPQIVAGRWLTPQDDRTLVVSRRLSAEQPALATGQSVMLLVNGKLERWTVAGVVETGIDAGAYATRSAVALSVGAATTTRLMIVGSDTSHSARLALIGQAREVFAAAGFDVSSAQVVDDGRTAIEDHLVMVVWFLGAMAQVMIVVGGLGLASTMSIGVMERTREIGVLRAIGATPRAVQALVHTEGLCIAALSWVLAVVLSMPIGLGLGAVFSRMMLPVPVKILPGAMSVFEWLLATLAISVVASFWPARRASSVQVREALAYE